jgi:hypothetical protein
MSERLGEPSPLFAAFDVADLRLVDAIVARNYRLRRPSVGTNLPDLSLSQFGGVLPLSARVALLRHHIGDVVPGRSEKEVRRVNAGSHVTPVTDAHPWWNRPSVCEVTGTVHPHRLAALRIGRDAIAIRPLGGAPEPATTFIDHPIRSATLKERCVTRAENASMCGISHWRRSRRNRGQGENRRYQRLPRPIFSTVTAKLKESRG